MKKARKDHYQEITDAIIAELENGVKPWGGVLLRKGRPAQNFLTRKPYRGINILTTAISAMKNGFDSPFWLTFRQAKKLGGHVIKGSKGTPIYFWNWIEKEVENEDGEIEIKKAAFLKQYTAFNAEQIAGIDFGVDAAPRTEVETIEAAEAILAGMKEKPEIEIKGLQPCYIPAMDMIRMPKQEDFKSDAQYYKTIFHEIGHWTGHESRLRRPGIVNVDRGNREQYAREELVAEMTAAFLAADAGIPEVAGIQESASYIDMYLELVRSDKKALVMAAAQAQKAADFILGDSAEASDAGGNAETA